MEDIEINQNDSTELKANKEHIALVKSYMENFAYEIIQRGAEHDNSKLQSPEKEGFDAANNTLNIAYDSEEYKNSLNKLKETLEHHYKFNSHHPQHYKDGINGMNLFDVVEMLLDWCASVKRYKNGNIIKSLEINKERFGISDQLYSILLNTVKYISMGL